MTTIGVFAPSGPVIERVRLKTAISWLRRDGFNVVLAKNLFEIKGWTAGSKSRRASQMNNMLRNPKIDILMAATGGEGASHILADIDYAAAKKKIVMGLSDISAILNAIHAKTKAITYHGPVICYGIVDPKNPRKIEKITYKRFLDCAKRGKTSIEPVKKFKIIKKGKGKGLLTGGNLEVFSRLIGTEYFPKGKIILLFEDLHAEIQDINRTLYQFRNAGIFKRTAGIILGNFEHITDNDKEVSIRIIEKVFLDSAKGYSFPIISGAMFGHMIPNSIIPIGKMAEIAGEKARIL